MTVPLDRLGDPAVRAFVTAVNAGDRAAFFDCLTPGASMSDDGSDRDLAAWVDKEIFSSGGHMEVETEEAAGRELVARFRNETWGEMRTRWRFETDGDRISRFETGQA
ncbi:nuclear transport factor 2 family protein [Streptomyces sp. NBC_00654]|uniref:nuclear transport factor 2 family protein n=1 Tax=Streptomyces sp. NBC_00654 TaxID=2975799 RepID=UPI002258C033|nr:nuclear transport factor 2 family protein [Streptomyces sp. NBC_00654]MCX4970591.1 nuclear transport factor 2 family protein [Streptomyces sp. NBC_00654]